MRERDFIGKFQMLSAHLKIQCIRTLVSPFRIFFEFSCVHCTSSANAALTSAWKTAYNYLRKIGFHFAINSSLFSHRCRVERKQNPLFLTIKKHIESLRSRFLTQLCVAKINSKEAPRCCSSQTTLCLHLLQRKNRVTLTYKVESLAELKFDPGFRVIGKYLSRIDSILRVNLN